MPGTDLEPLAPQDALDWYLEHRRDDLRTATRRKHRSALGTFVDWTDEAGFDDMNDLGGRQLMEFKTWRKSESDLVTVSLNGNLAILQRFLRFCEKIDAVEEGLAEKVPLPNVPPEEEINYGSILASVSAADIQRGSGLRPGAGRSPGAIDVDGTRGGQRGDGAAGFSQILP